MGLGSAASASGAKASAKVDITVSLDLPNGSGSTGPKVFERDNVTPGPGVELDATDLKSNPSDWCGSLSVDIDPNAEHITVAPDEPCDFQTAEVTITGGGYTGLSVLSDTLWVNPEAGSPGPTMDLVGATAAAAMSWHI